MSQKAKLDREELGRLGRRVWIQAIHAQEALLNVTLTPLATWEELDEPVREVYRYVGEAVAYYTLSYAIGDLHEVASSSRSQPEVR